MQISDQKNKWTAMEYEEENDHIIRKFSECSWYYSQIRLYIFQTQFDCI